MSTENLIPYNEVTQQKETNLKFLKKIIDVNDVSGVNVDLVHDEHLEQLDKYFKKIEKKFKNEVGYAASGVRKKIKFIVNSPINTNFSGEIMKSASNPNYGMENEISA